MRTIEWTSQFKRDYKRESKGPHRATLDDVLFPIVDCLANDRFLEPRHFGGTGYLTRPQSFGMP